MLALNEKQRRFVINVLELGGSVRKYEDCVIRAGFEGNANYIRQIAFRLVHDQRVQDAFIEESKRRLKAGAVMAVSRLLEIAEEDGVSTKDRLRALEMILNRTGFPTQTEQKVIVEHTMSDSELRARITNLSKELGLPIEKLLPPPAVDAEFVEITDPWNDEEHSTAGLEDLL